VCWYSVEARTEFQKTGEEELHVPKAERCPDGEHKGVVGKKKRLNKPVRGVTKKNSK